MKNHSTYYQMCNISMWPPSCLHQSNVSQNGVKILLSWKLYDNNDELFLPRCSGCQNMCFCFQQICHPWQMFHIQHQLVCLNNEKVIRISLSIWSVNWGWSGSCRTETRNKHGSCAASHNSLLTAGSIDRCKHQRGTCMKGVKPTCGSAAAIWPHINVFQPLQQHRNCCFIQSGGVLEKHGTKLVQFHQIAPTLSHISPKRSQIELTCHSTD